MSTSIKSYAIVEFLDSSPTTVQAVPCQWLLLEGGDLFSFWPPSKCDIQKLIKSYVQAKSTWEKFMVRQLGKADSYNEALKKAKAAELTSDLSASETSDLRTRHDRCRVVETDQDEEHVGLAKSTNKKHPQSAVLRHDSTGNTSGLCATAPPVPKGLELNALSWKNGAADPLQRDSAEGAGASHPNSSQVVLVSGSMVSGKQVTAMSSPAVGTSVGSMPSFSYRSPAVFVESVQNQVRIRRTPVSVRPSPSSAGYPLSDSGGRCMVDSPALQLMVKHMAELKEQVFFNTQLLQSLARRQRSSEKIGQLPENCPLPLDSLDSVNAISNS